MNEKTARAKHQSFAHPFDSSTHQFNNSTHQSTNSPIHQRSPVILFDGVCNLCNGFVQFVIRRDPGAVFRFASLQSDAAARLLRERGVTAVGDSVVLVDADGVYVESTAALRIAKRLGFPLSIWTAFVVLPRPVRDAVYRFIARHRYRWFGRRDSCMVPTPELRDRFLTD